MDMGALFCETAGAINAKKESWDSPPRPAFTSTDTRFALVRRTILSSWLYKPLHGKTSALGANGTEHGLCLVRPLRRPNHAGVFGHPGGDARPFPPLGLPRGRILGSRGGLLHAD